MPLPDAPAADTDTVAWAGTTSQPMPFGSVAVVAADARAATGQDRGGEDGGE